MALDLTFVCVSPALIYWILLTSVAAYLLMTWANQYADASLVLAYTPLQPATAAILSFLLIQAGVKGKLAEPGLNILGVIGIFIGLACVLYDNHKNSKQAGDYEQVGKINDVEESKGESWHGEEEGLGDVTEGGENYNQQDY